MLSATRFEQCRLEQQQSLQWSKRPCGAGLITYSKAERDTVIAYIANQKEHHRVRSFLDELKSLLDEAGVEYDPKYLFTD